MPTIPGGLDSQTSIRINDETFLIEADDLESQCVLGRGAYGVVEKVKHKQTGTILAVKVRFHTTYTRNNMGQKCECHCGLCTVS